MKKALKKVLSVLMVLALLLVPMTVSAELGDDTEPWQLNVSMGMMDRLAVYVEPGATQWVQAADMNGTVTVGYATGNYMLMYGRMPVYPETESGNYTATLQLQGYDIFSIYNPSETDAVTVYMTLASGGPIEIPEGSYDNPQIIEESGKFTANVEADTDDYYYEWTAPSYGIVTITMEDESGWQYQVNKTPVDEEDYSAYYNGYLHTFDEEEVVASEELVVYEGETVSIYVDAFDPENPWSSPAGTINWAFDFKETSTFMVTDVESYVGGEFDVEIKLENNPGIISLKLDVAYDSEVLEIVDVKGGDFTGATGEDIGTTNGFSHGPLTNNPIAINWIDPLSDNNTNNGTVAVLTFKVKEGVECDSETAITITYDPENVFDADFNNVEIGVMDGTVAIGHDLIAVDEIPATCTETGMSAHDKCEVCGKLFWWGMETTEEDLITDPFHDRIWHEEVPATTTSTGTKEHYTCAGCDGLWVMDTEIWEFVEVTEEDIVIPMLEPEFTYGDLSDDGKINNKDLGLLMQYLNGWEVEINMEAADVNGDGKVNNKDYGLLMQYLNGWDVTFGG